MTCCRKTLYTEFIVHTHFFLTSYLKFNDNSTLKNEKRELIREGVTFYEAGEARNDDNSDKP